MANNDNVRLLSLRSDPDIGKNISVRLNIPLTKVNIVDHANKEIKGQILSNIRGCNVYIICTGVSDEEHSINDYLMEALLMINACKGSSAESITLILPYYPYSRSDKKDDGRTAIGGKLVASLLEKAGITRMVTMDLHSGQIQGFFDVPVDNLYAKNLFIEYMKENYFANINNKMLNDQYVLISPDAGGIKRILAYAKKLHMRYAVMNKERDYSTESKVISSSLHTQYDISGKTAIIIDDMADTCGTVVAACNQLREYGIKDVIIMVTHGIFSRDAIDKINNCDMIRDIIVTNTLPQQDNMEKCEKVKTVDISNFVANVIVRLETGGSLSELFY